LEGWPEGPGWLPLRNIKAVNVVIEIDGNSHNEKFEYDRERNAFLEGLGLIVIRIMACDVLHRLEGVMRMLYNNAVFN